MSITVLYQGTINRAYLRKKTKDDIIELYMGTLNELDKANGQLKRLCNCLCEFEDQPGCCGETLDDAINHLRAYRLWFPDDEDPGPQFLQVYDYRGVRRYDGENRRWCWRGVVGDIWQSKDEFLRINFPTRMSLDQVPSTEPSIQPHSRTRPSDEDILP